jgi:hypothetical protein
MSLNELDLVRQFDGKAGTVENARRDELHGLRITIRGHDGKWPVSTNKFAQSSYNGS